MVIVWSDALLRYPELAKLPDVNSASTFAMVRLGEGYVSGRLASKYTVPFSNNNVTAQDLVIDAIFVQQHLSRQPEKAKTIKEYLDERIAALLDGSANMITTSGSIAGTLVGEAIWSSTQNYHPTFGMSDPLNWEVSSDMLIAENSARGHPIDEAL